MIGAAGRSNHSTRRPQVSVAEIRRIPAGRRRATRRRKTPPPLASGAAGPNMGPMMIDDRMTVEAQGGERSLKLALKRGWKRRCPNCGGGRLFDGYLTVRDSCMVCGEELHHHRADDMPAWATILIVGHIVAPLMLTVYDLWSPPLWVHWTLWPTLVLALALLLLPRIKGMVVAYQWAKRMGGFEGSGRG